MNIKDKTYYQVIEEFMIKNVNFYALIGSSESQINDVLSKVVSNFYRSEELAQYCEGANDSVIMNCHNGVHQIAKTIMTAKIKEEESK